MSGESIATKKVLVEVQENGIIRGPDGWVIARLIADNGYESLEEYAPDEWIELVNDMELVTIKDKAQIDRLRKALGEIKTTYLRGIPTGEAFDIVYDIAETALNPKKRA